MTIGHHGVLANAALLATYPKSQHAPADASSPRCRRPDPGWRRYEGRLQSPHQRSSRHESYGVVCTDCAHSPSHQVTQDRQRPQRRWQMENDHGVRPGAKPSTFCGTRSTTSHLALQLTKPSRSYLPALRRSSRTLIQGWSSSARFAAPLG